MSENLFAKRITVIDLASSRVDYLSRAAAINQIARGLVGIHLVRDGIVVWVKRLDTLADNEARPGSFGIRKQRSESVGSLFFQHKGHYGRAIEQMNEA